MSTFSASLVCRPSRRLSSELTIRSVNEGERPASTADEYAKYYAFVKRAKALEIKTTREHRS